MQQKTKKNILIVLAALAGLLLLAAGAWFLFFIAQFSIYQDVPNVFTVKYPNRWEKQINPQPGVAVIFLSPQETALDTFRENVNISIDDVPAHLATLQNFSNKIIEQMTKVFKNVQVTESRSIDFGGRHGYRVEFTAEKPDAMKILTVWTIKGGRKAYILTYIAMGKRYQTYLPLIETMIQSFVLK